MNYQMRLPSLKILFTFFTICFYQWVVAQYTIPPKPAVLYPVYDEAGMLDASEKKLLNDKLIKLYKESSTEILIVIINSAKEEDVNLLATRFGHQWGIGEKEQDNGLVFLIAKEDRKMAIQQGRGVEQYITASVAGQILDYLVKPYFKQGLYYQGINNATDAMIDAVNGKFKPLQKSERGEGVSLLHIVIIAFLAFLILSIIIRNNRGGGGGRGNYDDDEDVILSRRGRRSYPGGFFPFPPIGGGFGGGSFGSGSSDGGFGGFGGGGDFGGGGASGDW